MGSGWFRFVPDGLEITARLTPKSSRDAFDGDDNGANGAVWLKARVRAVPEDGKANKALIALLSKKSGVAKSRIRLQSGATSRLKTLVLECSEGEAREAIKRLLA